MITMQTVLTQMTGSEAVNSLIQFLQTHFEDFPPIRQAYTDAMTKLQETLGDSAKAAADAMSRRIASRLLFSGVLGIQANFNNFKDPVSGNFLTVEAEIFLRESTARTLPEYAAAQEVWDRFVSSLSAEQQTLYEDVAEYACYLETVGPKLAHYYGYLLGNELLPQIIPGYLPDSVLTLQYTAMLNQYFGEPINTLWVSS